MTQDFRQQRTLGRSHLNVGRLGLGSSFGGSAKAYEQAFEHGCNYFYWGSFRRDGMRQAIRNLAPRNRAKLTVVLQTYSRLGFWLKHGFHSGLKKLKLDYADVLLLGWYNEGVPERIMDAALELKEKGYARSIAVSCHHRPSFQEYIVDPRIDIIMVRYNAAHRGAEREVFPYLERSGMPRPGVVSYTTTRWGYLIDPKYTPPGVKTPRAVDCYRFSLTNPDVDVALCGPGSDEQMAENLKAIELGPMNSDELAWMRQVGDHVHKLTGKKFYSNLLK